MALRGLANRLVRPPGPYLIISLFCPIIAIWAFADLPYGTETKVYCPNLLCYSVNGSSNAATVASQAALSGNALLIVSGVLLVLAVLWSLTPWIVLFYGRTDHLGLIGAVGFFAQLPALVFGATWGYLVILVATVSGIFFSELVATRLEDNRAARERHEMNEWLRSRERERERKESEENRMRQLEVKREAQGRAEKRASPRLTAAKQLEEVARYVVEYSREPIAYPSVGDLRGLASTLSNAAENLQAAGLADLNEVKHPLRELQNELVKASNVIVRPTTARTPAPKGNYIPLTVGGASISRTSFVAFSEALQAFSNSIGVTPSPTWPTKEDLKTIRENVQKLVDHIPSFIAGFNRSLLGDGKPGGSREAKPMARELLGPRRSQYEYDVAISYASEDAQIANAIHRQLGAGGVRVFFAEAFTSRLWGKDLSDEFQRIYGPESLYVLVLVSQSYSVKEWTDFEFDIARGEQKNRKEEFILPVRLDNTKMFGLRSTMSFVDINKIGIEGVVRLLLEKLEEGRPRG